MEKKAIAWKTKGMNQDLSVSSFNPEFAFENKNLRLSTKEGNTSLSWVNEKGTKEISVYLCDENPWSGDADGENSRKYEIKQLSGSPIGTAVINDKLVLFTHKSGDAKPDRIYVIYNPPFDIKVDGVAYHVMRTVQIYCGNLNFSIEHPLETLVSYENGHIQKVYWTDGYNQPRLINVAVADLDSNRHLPSDSSKKLRMWNNAADFTNDYDGSVQTFFDFVPSVRFDETFTISQEITGSGVFAPGVIQYCFTYVNKYSQETNIIDVSPLYYLVHKDRGASPDESKVTCSFTIAISGLDKTFDAVRLYSIQRSSLNGEPLVKELATIPYSSPNYVEYTDNGTTGAIIDPWKLLYVGGKEIAALTMAEKSQTLFLGNIEEKNTGVDAIQEHFNSSKVPVSFTREEGYKVLDLEPASGIYPFSLSLKDNHRKISTFKGGETYRFGFQLQKVTGEWSEPVYLNDATNDKYPDAHLYDNEIRLAYAQATVPITSIDTDTYKRIRPVIVYPNIQDRNILCQGVLNPTVFNAYNRKEGVLPFSQASWYFRPYVADFLAQDSDRRIPYMTISRSGSGDFICNAANKKTVYILVGRIYKNNVLQNIRNTGQVSFVKYDSSGNQGERKNHAVYGIISLGSEIDKGHNVDIYAFISETKWTDDTFGKYKGGYDPNDGLYEVYAGYRNSDGSGENGLRFNIWKDSDTGVEKIFEMDSLLRFDTQKYPIKGSFTDGYVFKCGDTTGWYYSVTFHNLAAMADNSLAGSTVQFEHYMPIHAQDEAVSLQDSTTNLNSYDDDKILMTEIMGSVNEYNIWDNDGAGSEISNHNSNTQFFVDQSIVTLNSPDIEFDTSTQMFGGENLHLRIIGAIPITSTLSSHSILLDGNMLETYHNQNNGDHIFGTGEINLNVKYHNINPSAGRRLVAAELWNDVIVDTDNNEKITEGDLVDYVIHPWHRDASLNNDFSKADASSKYKYKQESNLLYSYNTEYLPSSSVITIKNIETKTMLTENSQISNYRFKAPLSGMSEINYYPNVDAVLFNKDKYVVSNSSLTAVTTGTDIKKWLVKDVVSMKYKSTSHAIIALGAGENQYSNCVCVLPNGLEPGDPSTPIGKTPRNDDQEILLSTFWGDEMKFRQDEIQLGGLFKNNNTHVAHNYLWLGELYKEPVNRFGGDSKEAIRNNIWVIGGPTVKLEGSSVILRWLDGDTFYQRYDCLKTYPFTKEDTNQLVEILSFMCETRVNIDGRYDKHRGETLNHLMDPTTFNLMNDVYSQHNNYFTSQQTDTKDYNGVFKYPNRAWFSKTKTSGADVDEWTNVVTSSTVEFDGSRGQLNAIRRLGDQLIAFQDTGISHILYDEKVQIATQQGVPIEIANSGKVQGVQYYSTSIGCSNKWSIATTPSGIYFIDSYNKDIYLFNGQLSNLSSKLGFDAWCKQNFKTGRHWTPTDFDKDYVSYYDPINQDVMFISAGEALAYSEKIGTFTSFYDYNAPYFCHLGDSSIWITPTNDGKSKLWAHQEGEYCNFFGENKEFSMTLIGNPEPTKDKIFTNLEFRACVEAEEASSTTGNKDLAVLPFDKLDTRNEYQQGSIDLNSLRGHASMRHFWNDGESLKRRFRMWRCDIPRDGRNRMRNPWLYLKLQKNAAAPGNSLNKTEIHDLLMTYFS